MSQLRLLVLDFVVMKCCELFQTTEVPDVWEHDMFDDDRPPRGSRSFGAQKSAKLIITNLDYGVTDQDIRVRISVSVYIIYRCAVSQLLGIQKQTGASLSHKLC